MILTIKEADFSANNLGQIIVPVEITDAGREFMAQYNTVFTETQQYAIQHMLNNLGYGVENSVWSKLKMFVMPVLSSNVDEAVYDVIASAAITKNAVTFSNHALNGASGAYIELPSNRRTTEKEVTFLYSGNGAMSFGSPEYVFVEYVTSIGERVYFKYGTNSSDRIYYYKSSANVPVAAVFSYTSDMLKFVDFKTENVVADATKKATMWSYIGNNTTRRQPLLSNGALVYYSAVAEPLTTEECITFNKAMRTILSAFGITI